MVEGKGNRSNCKTWILALREPLCARPVAMDGSDFGKFNTALAHKQKTRKINLGRMGGSREPKCGFLLGWKRAWMWVLGSVATKAVLGATEHWAGQLQEAAATPLPWTLGGRRGHRDSGQEWPGRSSVLLDRSRAGGSAGATTAHPRARRRAQQQIALCRFF